MKIEIRPSTLADFEAFYGKKPDRTVKAVTVLKDGEIATIAGVTIESDKIVAFSDIGEGVTAPKITIWRTARAVIQVIKDMRLPVMAISDHEKDRAGKFLESLGFRFIGECKDGKVYRL